MTVRIRPARNGKQGIYEYSIRFRWPEGGVFRERRDAPVTGKSAAQRYAEARERALLNAGKAAHFAAKEVAPSSVVTKPVLVEELEEKWFALIDGDPDLKASTRAAHKCNFRANIKPKLGKIAIVDLSTPVLRDWIRELRKSVATSTVRNNVNSLTRFLADAKAERWAPLFANPMKDEEVRAMVPPMEVPEPEGIEHWTRPAFEQLLALPLLPDERFGRYLVDVTSGMRDGELFGAQFKHLGLEDSIPFWKVVQQLSVARGRKPSELGPPKGKSRGKNWSKRTIPLHPLAADWLRWWKSEGWARYVGRKPTEEDFVFPDPCGDKWRLRPRSAEILRDDLSATGLPEDFVLPDGEKSPFVFHAIRHTFATWLQANDVAGDLVDRLLGQAPSSTRARHYAAPNLATLARAVATIELTLPKHQNHGAGMEQPDSDEKTAAAAE